MHDAPLLLDPVATPKSWGSELWLNSTRPEGPARVRGDGALADLLRARPALLGDWARRLHGDELPIFTKLINIDFPPLVHLGFNRAVARAELIGWFTREQQLLRRLYASLRVESRAVAEELTRAYGAWATAQALARWRRPEEGAAAALGRFVDGARAAELPSLLRELRENRAAFVDVLNEIDLRREEGNLLLSPAGMIHAIFGLSHQTHPLDGARARLSQLLGELRRRAQAGVSEAELIALADAADLPSLRAANAAPPKNEAWMPLFPDDRLTLVEPQQTSDTTYSLADFYTPFVWDGSRLRFRKGDASGGLSDETLSKQLADVDLSPAKIDDVRCAPVAIAERAGARLYRLVDDPERWPFFTAHRLDLDDARFGGDHAPGVFQQLVVLDGEVDLLAAGGHSQLNASTPAFLPATLSGGWELAGSARVLILSVPGAHGERAI